MMNYENIDIVLLIMLLNSKTKSNKKVYFLIYSFFSLFFFHYRMAFAKVWYDIYDNRREHVASVILRKSHLRGKIQHRVPEFEIIGNDETTSIGRIYPFSTDLERTEYGQAVAVKSIFHFNYSLDNRSFCFF
uniref:Uncharacterized protein n=1 Tax=Adineta vaga TaxID=104782 RepID=B3G406_ADIVA|nr:hypothetical protein [Adineta vaga]